MANIQIPKLKEALGKNPAYLPMLEYFLKEENPVFAFTGEEKKRVKQIRIGNVQRNALFLSEFRQIMRCFHEAGINAILLKGLMLENLYPDGLRTFSDIDLLLKKENLPEAGKVLNLLGYLENIEPRPGTVDIRKNIGYTKKGQGQSPLFVEIHYRLGPCPYMDRLQPSLLFRNAGKMKIGGMETTVLSCEDLLIHLALHVFSHIPDPCIISICDIRQIACRRGESINWELFIAKAEQYRLALPLRYAFKKTREIFDIPIPDYARFKLDALKTGRREIFIFSLLESPKRSLSNTGKLLFGFRTVRKIRLVFHMVFPSRKYMLHKYKTEGPRTLLFCYLLYIKDHLAQTFSWLAENFQQ